MRQRRQLYALGMGNSIINWIEQWLKDRRQRVVVDGEVSSWKPVLSGVPQGSVLGPILFLIYINDLEDGVTGNILKFADDTKLFRKVKEIGDKQKLQDDIDKLVKWSEKWQMLFKGVDPDTKVGGTAYMSTQREVFEGQTGSHRAKRANFGRGVRGSSPGKFQKPTWQMVQSTLFLSYICEYY